jgi:hypothetical protein
VARTFDGRLGGRNQTFRQISYVGSHNASMDPGTTIALWGFGGFEIGAVVSWAQRAIQNLPQPRYVCACAAVCAVAGAGVAVGGEANKPTSAGTKPIAVPALVRSLGPGPVQPRGAPAPAFQVVK